MSVSTCKKAINFDLDTNALKINYGGSNYREAYIDIETFMEHNGFEHRQWSGYISKYEMSTQDIQMIVINMGKTFPWLGSCVKKFDVTDIGQQHDLTELIKSCSAHMKNHENIKLFELQNSYETSCSDISMLDDEPLDLIENKHRTL